MTWLYTPSNFAQASECLAKDCEPGSTTWASRLAPSVTLSGKPMPSAYWQRTCKPGHWTTRLSGATFAPLMAQLGMGKWIASLPDSHAKTSQLQGGALVLTANAAGFSSKSSASQPIAVRGLCGWKTLQESIVPEPPLWTKPANQSPSAPPPASWENWPTSAGIRNGSLFQRPMWAPATGGQGGSAWHGGARTTPTALERSGQCERNSALTLDVKNWATPDCNTSTYSNGKMGPNIREQASQWLTPNVPNGGRSVSQALVQSKGMTDAGEKKTVGLESQTRFWATPTSNEHTGAGHSDSKQGSLNLRSQSVQWPTPRGTDGTKGGPNQAGSKGDLMLPSASAQWPTPASRDSKGANSAEHCTVTGGGRKHMDQLANFVAHTPSLPQAPAIPDGQTSLPPSLGAPQPSAKRLNPYFAEHLMGWPEGWTLTTAPHGCDASAMALWRSKLRQRLYNLCEG